MRPKKSVGRKGHWHLLCKPGGCGKYTVFANVEMDKVKTDTIACPECGRRHSITKATLKKSLTFAPYKEPK